MFKALWISVWIGSMSALWAVDGYAPVRFQTPSGSQGAWVSLPDVAMIDVSLVWDAGARREEQPGLAYLTGKLLDQGSVGLDRASLARGFESVGARCNVAVDMDQAIWHCRMLSDPAYREGAIAMWARALKAPLFAQAMVLEKKQEMQTAWQALAQNPATLASMQFKKALYADHPYARHVLGGDGAAVALDGKMAKRFYQRFYAANHAWVVITGDITQKDAMAMANRLSASMPKASASLPEVPPVLPNKAATMHIEKPLTQTTWFFGTLAPKYNDDAWWALHVGNQILGGGMQSRLFKAIREDKGYAYYAGSNFTRLFDRGAFYAIFQARSQVAKAAAILAKQTLETFVAKGPTDQEVAWSKNVIANGFYGVMSQNGSRHQALVRGLFYGLPDDYWDGYLARLQKVGRADVQQAFAAMWQQGKHVEVSVGGK